MLAAALLALSAHNPLEAALERASAALQKEGPSWVNYLQWFEDEKETAVFDTMRIADGPRVRYEAQSSGGPALTVVRTPKDLLAANFVAKKWALVNDDEDTWNGLMPASDVRAEPGDWIFVFTVHGDVVLRANPAFEVKSESKGLWRPSKGHETVKASWTGGQVRTLEIASVRKSTGTSVTGQIHFDATTGVLLGAEISDKGPDGGEYTIQLLMNVQMSPNDLAPWFKINSADYAGLEKVTDPPVDS